MTSVFAHMIHQQFQNSISPWCRRIDQSIALKGDSQLFATGVKSHKPSPAIQAAIDAVREQAWGIRSAANGAAGLAKAKTANPRDLQHATSIGARSPPAGMLAGPLEDG